MTAIFILFVMSSLVLIALGVSIPIMHDGVIVSKKVMVNQKFITRGRLHIGGGLCVIFCFLLVNIATCVNFEKLPSPPDEDVLKAISVMTVFLASYVCCAIYQTIKIWFPNADECLIFTISFLAGLGICFISGPAYWVWQSHMLQWFSLGGLTALLLIFNYLIFNQDRILKIWQQFLIKRSANTKFEVVASIKNADMIPYHFDKDYIILLNVLGLKGRKHSRFEIEKRSSDLLFNHKHYGASAKLIELATKTLLQEIPF